MHRVFHNFVILCFIKQELLSFLALKILPLFSLQSKFSSSSIPEHIFIKINPTGYAVAFAKLEERFKAEIEMVNQWRKALKHAADLSGLDSNKFR